MQVTPHAVEAMLKGLGGSLPKRYCARCIVQAAAGSAAVLKRSDFKLGRMMDKRSVEGI